MSFAFEKTPRISLYFKLDSVQCREYEYGLFGSWILNKMRASFLWISNSEKNDNIELHYNDLQTSKEKQLDADCTPAKQNKATK